ncbi:hypothetical protein GGF46_000940 [Coemansia sp. RSA 552]|nr:hypothetical protein GGF46_000940 [Coemansia sp. RSA 552]
MNSDAASPAATPAVSALMALLGDLEAQQQALVSRLQCIHEQLASGASEIDDEELATTLTYYIGQASHIKRRMVLVRGRVGDLKRRSDRLREHRASQNQQVAEWAHQERSRVVPAAAVAGPRSQTPDITLEGGDAAKSDSDRRSVLSLLSPLRVSTSLGGRTLEGGDVGGSGQGAAQSVGGSRPATPMQVAPSSPALSTVSTLDSTQAPAAPIALVKRKGKRRVRKIE